MQTLKFACVYFQLNVIPNYKLYSGVSFSVVDIMII